MFYFALDIKAYLQSLSCALCPPLEPAHLGRTLPYPILFFFVLCHAPTTELRDDARVCLDDLANNLC